MRIQRFSLKTAHFGTIDILRPIPSEKRVGDTLEVDPWGDLAPIRDEVPQVAGLIPVISGDEMSLALHGHAKPLMERLGPYPKALLKLTPVRVCGVRHECVMYDKKRCHPQPKLPECWTPEEVPEIAKRAVAVVTLAWAEGRFVVVVDGAEFRLLG